MAEKATAGGLVYREGKEQVSSALLLRELSSAVAKLSANPQEAYLGALLRAGELECALSDAARDDAIFGAAVIDLIADLACGVEYSGPAIQNAQALLVKISASGKLTVSRPEGFAYYALHPLDFADLISASRIVALAAFVVGIRSIGTTLSAVVAARLRGMHIPVQRTTVRPFGHPYDRRTEFRPEQRIAISKALGNGSVFLICDEGPGRSGSSFLSVADALEREGLSRERIVLLCSHEPDPEALCAPDAAARWRRYRCAANGMPKRLPPEAGECLGGGEWRRVLIPTGVPWSATWPQLERLKYLSRDSSAVFKFEGYGPYGETVRRREESLSESRFGLKYLGQTSGFGSHPLLREPEMSAADVSPAFLTHMARYCAWRTIQFKTDVSDRHVHQLETMAATNLESEFGCLLDLRLPVERLAICDARMQPSKWRAAGDDSWVKLDASTHGDDHFFPGPTDIAWDLAGACVEWNLTGQCRQSFLNEYRRASGDKPFTRLPEYELAYVAFRLAWCRMAASSVQGTEDETRLLREYQRYRSAAELRVKPRGA